MDSTPVSGYHNLDDFLDIICFWVTTMIGNTTEIRHLRTLMAGHSSELSAPGRVGSIILPQRPATLLAGDLLPDADPP